MDGLLQINI